MGALQALAKIGEYIPSPPRPSRKPDLKWRLIYTLLALVIYYVLASTVVFPLVSVATQFHGFQLPALISVVFASARGTIAQLGIGPMVTAGLIIQILVGAKLIDLDLTLPADRKLFTQAEKGLGVIIAGVEAAGFSMAYGLPSLLTLAIFLQFMFGAIILMILDEAIQKGYGIGSGISLFILAGVARTIVWDMLAPVLAQGTDQYYGIFPYLAQAFTTGTVDMTRLLYGFNSAFYQATRQVVMPSLTGLITVFVLIAVLVYLQQMRVRVPIMTQRAPGIRTSVPLQFIYVTNIPILLVGIVLSDLILFNRLVTAYLSESAPWLAGALQTAINYLSPPRGLLSVMIDPLRALINSVIFVGLAILFGLMWVEIAGLSPSAYAENLIKSGLQMPGLRRNPKVLEMVLARYIYPLAILSSIIVAVIALTADIFGAFGTGTGILLAVGIVLQFYQQIAYERALEAYPLLKRLIGE